MVSVSKKIFKHAVDRNFIKRKIREAVRHKRHIIEEETITEGKKYIFAITYVGRKIPKTTDIFETLESLFLTWKSIREDN